MRKSDRILGWVLLGLALFSLGEGWRTWDKIGGTGFMPVIIGIIFSLLGLGLLFSRSHPEKNESIFGTEQTGWRRVGLTCITFALYILTIQSVGYALGTIVFLTILFKIMGVIRWRTGFIFGIVASASTYVIFKIWLSMPLPAGFWGY
jgi:hypothetical protein